MTQSNVGLTIMVGEIIKAMHNVIFLRPNPLILYKLTSLL